MTEEQMNMLLKSCKNHPELYNKVSRWLFRSFNMNSAAVTLLITYYLIDHNMEVKR